MVVGVGLAPLSLRHAARDRTFQARPICVEPVGSHPILGVKPKTPPWPEAFLKWWWELDSNQRRINPADLQSALVGHLSIPPNERRFHGSRPEVQGLFFNKSIFVF